MVFFNFIQILIEYSVSKQWGPDRRMFDLARHCLSMSHKQDTRIYLYGLSYIMNTPILKICIFSPPLTCLIP